ncbi:DivIVA domain-containing protein [Micromonospora sp. PTRAS2]
MERSTDEGGGLYRTTRHLLTPVEVRWQRFPMTRFGRRGLDPEAVATFLRRVEIDTDTLYREAVAAQDEARRHQATVLELQAECRRPRELWAPRRRGEYRRAPVWPLYKGRPPDGGQDDD